MSQPYLGHFPAPERPDRPGVEPGQDRALGWVALALSFLGCLPLVPLAGAITGTVALLRRRLTRRWPAVVGVVVGLAMTALQVAALPSVVDGIRAGVEEIEREMSGTRLTEIGLGDCFDSAIRTETGDETIEETTVDPRSCDEPHDLEVYHVITLEGDDFPGADAVQAEAERCVSWFPAFVLSEYAESALEIYFYFPTERSWDVLGDRTIVCAVGDPQQQTVGTLERSRR